MLAAERVLEHCRVALGLLEEEEDGTRWNVHWAGGVALLRAVGHVLDKVDVLNRPELRSPIKRMWTEWNSELPAHVIFREFINLERNNLLKEFRSGVHPSGFSKLVIEGINIAFSLDDNDEISDLHVLDRNLFRPILSGYGEGEDARDVYREGIGWWESQLKRLIVL